MSYFCSSKGIICENASSNGYCSRTAACTKIFDGPVINMEVGQIHKFTSNFDDLMPGDWEMVEKEKTCEICGSTSNVEHYICKECKKRLVEYLYGEEAINRRNNGA